MLRRRSLLTAAAAAGFVPAAPAILRAAENPGVTATEIRIGNTMPYSGPASAYGTIGKADAAAFRMANDMGGFAGRKINFISYDDSYSPPKTVEQIRRLVEQDQVACLFNTLGTPSNTAIVKYCNEKAVPQLFVSSGADKWGNYKEHPWTIGWQPSYVTEAQIYAKYILKEKPGGKIGILYQNDDFGKDYLTGFRDVLKDNFDKLVTLASYEVTDATIEFAACQPPECRGRGAGDDRDAEIRRPEHPQSGRDELEAAARAYRRVGLGRRRHAAGGDGERHRHRQFRLRQGPDRPPLGQ